MAGYFFFNRIEKLENEAQKKEYAISYLLKTLKIYFVWSVVLLPSRLILSKSSMLGVLLKWFRTVFFIGDAQLLIIPGISEPPVQTLRATIPENERHIFR